jgi:hypothetical protein
MTPHGAYSLHPPYQNLVYPPASWVRYTNPCAGAAWITAQDYLRWLSRYDPGRSAPPAPPRGGRASFRLVGKSGAGKGSRMGMIRRPGKKIHYAIILIGRGRKRKPEAGLGLMLFEALKEMGDWPDHDLFEIQDPRAAIPRERIKPQAPSPVTKSTTPTRGHASESAPKEPQGWQPLFEKELKLPPSGWAVESGALVSTGRRKLDLVTAGAFADFELVFQWKATKGANSGVYYRAPKDVTKGPEFQIVDNENNPSGRKPLTACGSVYGVAPARKDFTRKHGFWNEGRIVAIGNLVEHYVNGHLVVKVELGRPLLAIRPEGRIALQNHTGRVAFKNMKLRRLPDSGSAK